MIELSNSEAAEIFAQLGNETRLCIVRVLVEAGNTGLKVGDIQSEVGIPNSTLSHHLLYLRNAGLVTQRKAGRVLFYALNYECLDQVLAYLQTNCCVREQQQNA